ncbi:MAG: hypothetical protein U5R14_11790 [Gemmatimonadota bacterium]|nr:hypothetical protein [Gemmatimonadota bacterium]
MAERSPSGLARSPVAPRRLALVLTLSAMACSGYEAPVAPLAPVDPGGSPVATVLLVGDGGAVTSDSPILAHLGADARRSASLGPTLVAFLGDNVYPDGVRAPGDPEHGRDTTKLALQLEAVAGSGARALFMAGNHDWAGGAEDGLSTLERQAAWVEAADRRGAPVTWLPEAGCPGPSVVDVAEVRLVVLDTQWFIHEHARGCAERAPKEISDALTTAIDGAEGREVVVLGHHPLRTHGPHGGYIPADRHLFPLRDLWSSAFVPLPVLGTAYVMARVWGISDQDLAGDGNERMRASIQQALRSARRPPRLFAAAHEHSLQVLRGGEGGPAYHLVSGSASKVTPVSRAPGTLFATSEIGYLKVEVGARSIRLSAVVVTDRSSPEAPLGWCVRVDRASGSEASC